MSTDCCVGLCVHREEKPWVMELGENERIKASGYVHDHWADSKRVNLLDTLPFLRSYRRCPG